MSTGVVSGAGASLNSGPVTRQTGSSSASTAQASSSDLRRRLQRIEIMVEVLERPELDFEGQFVDELA